MAKVNTATFNDFVKNAQVLWRRGYDRVPLRAKELYDVTFKQVKTSDYSALDGFTFAKEVAEGDDFSQETPTQGYSKTMTKYRVARMAIITYEMRLYDRYREMNKKLQDLGEAVSQRMELDLTHRLTFGTATTYTNQDGRSVTISTGDTLSLFNTAHTVNGSSTTFRNRVANNPIFSRSGLEAAELLFATQMIDHAGNKNVVMPDTVVSTDDPSTVNTILEFLNSTASPTVSNSGVTNVYKGKYRHIVLPYLATTATGARDSAKEKYWMLASVAHTDAVCEVSENPHLVAPSPKSNAEDFDNDDWKFKASASYGIEIVDPRWIVLSLGDLTA